MTSSRALYTRSSRREQRKSAPLIEPIRRSKDLDAVLAQDDRDEFVAVWTGMDRNPDEHPEQAFRRGLQQGAADVYHALEKAQLLDERTLKKLNHFVYWKLFWFRYAKRRRFCRHIVRDRPPRLEINPKRRTQD